MSTRVVHQVAAWCLGYPDEAADRSAAPAHPCPGRAAARAAAGPAGPSGGVPGLPAA
jgi:hypothetical protein